MATVIFTCRCHARSWRSLRRRELHLCILELCGQPLSLHTGDEFSLEQNVHCLVVVVVVQTVEQRARVCPGTQCEMQLIRGSQTPQNTKKKRFNAPRPNSCFIWPLLPPKHCVQLTLVSWALAAHDAVRVVALKIMCSGTDQVPTYFLLITVVVFLHHPLLCRDNHKYISTPCATAIIPRSVPTSSSEAQDVETQSKSTPIELRHVSRCRVPLAARLSEGWRRGQLEIFS